MNRTAVGLSRPSTSSSTRTSKTWMPAPSAGMTVWCATEKFFLLLDSWLLANATNLQAAFGSFFSRALICRSRESGNP
jgi:hypothetical protein